MNVMKEKILKKKCGSCEKIKHEADFYKNSCRPDGLQTCCKSCNTLMVRKRYLNDKKYYTDKNKEARLINQKFIYDYLSVNPCVYCGEKDPLVLEFEHKKDKKHNLSDLIRKSYAIKTLKEEIENRKVICANCHMRHIAKNLGWYSFVPT